MIKVKSIGIYIWELPYRYGGTESCAVKFAWALQKIFPNASVEFVTEIYDKNDLPKNRELIQRLNKLAGIAIDENRAGIKPVFCSKNSRFQRRIMYSKIQNASKNFDLFFYCSRGNFSFKAKKNIAIIHFPVLPIVKEKKSEGKFDISFISKSKDKRYAKSYDLFLPNSKYTEYWLKKIRPDINPEKIIQIYHPVIPIPNTSENKQKAILAVSRIEKDKKIEILLEAYKASKYLTENYELWIAGNKDINSSVYLENLKSISKGYRIKFYISISHEELVSLYNRALFFWHSKGYGIDENKNPEQLEHFGMTTVEAMSAGCIPAVINKGGQPEIVTDDCGFLWNTPEELAKITETAAQFPQSKLQNLSENARKRSRNFKLEDFSVCLEELLHNIL